MKKLILGLLIIGIISTTLWYFFFRNENNNINTSNQNGDQTDLFPFGQGNIIPGQPNKQPTSTISNLNQGEGDGKDYLPLLRKIWSKPVAGGIVFDRGSSTKIRFVEQSTGYVYETTKSIPTVVRFSNTTIPRIQETVWQSDGNKVLIRYLREDNETIRTFSALIPTTTDSAIDGVFLADNIESPTIFKDKVAYITTSVEGATVITSDLDGSKKVAIFTSPANEWKISWTNPNLLALWSAPGISSPGALYTLDTVKGGYNRITSGVYGGEGKLNKDGSLMLLTGAFKNSIGSAVVNTKTGDKKVLPIGTLIEKCAWSPIATSTLYCAVPEKVPAAKYPDDWHQGNISFNDAMWRIDTVTGSTEELFNPEVTEGEGPMDIMNLTINSKGDTLLFRNKKDQLLWSYDIYEL